MQKSWITNHSLSTKDSFSKKIVCQLKIVLLKLKKLKIVIKIDIKLGSNVKANKMA